MTGFWVTDSTSTFPSVLPLFTVNWLDSSWCAFVCCCTVLASALELVVFCVVPFCVGSLLRIPFVSDLRCCCCVFCAASKKKKKKIDFTFFSFE